MRRRRHGDLRLPVTASSGDAPPPAVTLYYGWILVVALGITTIISYGTSYYLFGVLLLHGTSLGWLVTYIIVYGGAFGAISPLRAAVMADHFGRRAYGAITAIQGVPVALAAGAGPLLAGVLYDHLGGYTVPFWLCAGAFLLAGLAVALTPRPAMS
ncbi:MAG TPA: MFS transporter [Chloroflexota bacterium]